MSVWRQAYTKGVTRPLPSNNAELELRTLGVGTPLLREEGCNAQGLGHCGCACGRSLVGKREKLDRFFAQLAETLKIKHIEYIENGKPVLFLGDYIAKYKDKITLKNKDTYVDG